VIDLKYNEVQNMDDIINILVDFCDNEIWNFTNFDILANPLMNYLVNTWSIVNNRFQ
jgi:hypothetical protein